MASGAPRLNLTLLDDHANLPFPALRCRFLPMLGREQQSTRRKLESGRIAYARIPFANVVSTRRHSRQIHRSLTRRPATSNCEADCGSFQSPVFRPLLLNPKSIGAVALSSLRLSRLIAARVGSSSTPVLEIDAGQERLPARRGISDAESKPTAHRARSQTV